MAINCKNFFYELGKAVDDVNFKIVDHMTDPQMQYEKIRYQQNVTADYFFDQLKEYWGKIINDFVDQGDCPSTGLSFGKLYTAYNIPDTETAIEFLIEEEPSFELELDMQTSLFNLVKIFMTNCKCHQAELLKILGRKYFQKYFPIYASDPEVRSYVINKTKQILDHTEKYIDQIDINKLKDSSLVNKLKSQIKSIRDRVGSTGPEFDFGILEETLGQIRDSDPEKIYTDMINKIILHLESIKEYLRTIQLPTLPARTADIADNLKSVLESVKESSKLIKIDDTATVELEKILENIRTQLNIISEINSKEQLDILTSKLESVSESAKRQLDLIQTSDTGKIYSGLIAKIKSQLDLIKEQARTIPLPDLKEKSVNIIDETKNTLELITIRVKTVVSDDPLVTQALTKLESVMKSARTHLDSLRVAESDTQFKIIRNKLNFILKSAREYLDQIKTADLKNIHTDFINKLNTHLESATAKIHTIQIPEVSGVFTNRIDQIKSALESAKQSVRSIRSDDAKITNLTDELNTILESAQSELDMMQTAKSNEQIEKLRQNIRTIFESVEKYVEQIKESDPNEKHSELIVELKSRIESINKYLNEIDLPQIKETIGDIARKLKPDFEYVSKSVNSIKLDNPHVQKLKSLLKFVQDGLSELDEPESDEHVGIFKTQLEDILEIAKEQLEQIRTFDVEHTYTDLINKLSYHLESMREKLHSAQIPETIDSYIQSQLDLINKSLDMIKADGSHEEKLVSKLKSLVSMAKGQSESHVSGHTKIYGKLSPTLESIEDHLRQLDMSKRPANNKLIEQMISELNVIKRKLGMSGGTNNSRTTRLDLGNKINSTVSIIKDYLDTAELADSKEYYKKIIDDAANQLSMIYGFSVGGELDRLIPSELGSLKVFFVKLISA